MRVLITLPDLHFGGASNLLLRNMKALMSLQDIKLYIMYFGTNDTLKQRFEESGVALVYVKYFGLRDLPTAIMKIRSFIRNNKIDIVHTNLIFDKVLVAFSIMGSGVKRISTIHSSQIERYKSRWKLKLLLKIERILSNYFYNKTIVVSKAALESAISERGISEKKLTLIYNGITALEKNRKVEALAEGILFITACRLMTIKGLDRLIKVFSKIDNSENKHKLVIMGDGPLMNDLKKMSLDLDTQHSIIFTGFIEKVDVHLNFAHYYVNSSFAEAMPISVLEAMSIGLPIIASNVGGLKEIVSDGRNGYLIDFNDVQGSVAIFNRVISSHKKIYDQLSRQSERDFQESYSSESYLRNLIDLYCTVLK